MTHRPSVPRVRPVPSARRVLSTLGLLLASAAASAEAAEPLRSLDHGYDVVHYDLALNLANPDGAFDGCVTMTARGLAPDRAEVLYHAAPSLELRSVEVLTGGAAVAVPWARQGNVVHVDRALVAPAAHEFQLRTCFAGTAEQADQVGLFLATIPGAALPGWYTELSPQFARRLVPVVDDPGDRATWDVHVTADARYRILSNGDPAGCKAAGEGRQTCTWRNPDSVPIHALSVVAAELDLLEGEYTDRSGRTVPLAIYTEPGRTGDAAFAMETLRSTLGFYEDEFGLVYPWSRYAIVVQPESHRGGVSNKGLATLAGRVVYWRDGMQAWQRGAITKLITRELADEWFGNLAAPGWWSDLWLTEALSDWASTHADSRRQYPVLYHAREFYGAPSSPRRGQDNESDRALYSESFSDVSALYDTVTMYRGPDVVQMLHTHAGNAEFRRFLGAWLKRGAEGPVDTTTFLALVESELGVPTGALSPWIRTSAFPHLHFRVKLRNGDRTVRIRWSQRDRQGRASNLFVPIVVAARPEGGLPEVRAQSAGSQSRGRLVLELDGPLSQLIVNPENAGYYRYEVEGWDFVDWAREFADGHDPFGRAVALRMAFFSGDALAADELRDDRVESQLVRIYRRVLQGPLPGGPEALEVAQLRVFALDLLHEHTFSNLRAASIAEELAEELRRCAYGQCVPVELDYGLAIRAREGAIRALGEDRELDHLPLYREWMADPELDVRLAALWAYMDANAPDRWEVFDTFLRSPDADPTLRRTLVSWITYMAGPSGVERIRGYLQDPTLFPPGDLKALGQVLNWMSGRSRVFYSEEGQAFVLESLLAHLDAPRAVLEIGRDISERPSTDEANRAMLVGLLTTVADALETAQPNGDEAALLRELSEDRLR